MEKIENKASGHGKYNWKFKNPGQTRTERTGLSVSYRTHKNEIKAIIINYKIYVRLKLDIENNGSTINGLSCFSVQVRRIKENYDILW